MSSTTSKIVWQGESWRLREVTRPIAANTAVTRGIIEHPGSVVLIPIRPSDNGVEVLMIRQYRLALDETILELPAGTRHWDEPWPACAQRELREETGFQAAALSPLGDIWPAPGLSNEQMKLYLAEDLTPAPLPGDIDEAIEVTPLPLKELINMAQDGRLQDAKSIIGLYRTAVFLNLADQLY